MKRLYIVILSVMLSTYTIAKDIENDITMVSYEQNYNDTEGTLGLKNNSYDEIHNVSFRITYFDMSANPIDYKEFKKNVDIAPGMTKKFDIPAYEHRRLYHYYKSNYCPTDSPAFKIHFELLDYNTEPSYWHTLSSLLYPLIGLGLVLGMCGTVTAMAQRRHRNCCI